MGSEFFTDLDRDGDSVQEAEVQYWYLGNSVLTLVELIDDTAEAVNFIRHAVDNSGLSDQELEDKLSSYVEGHSNSEVVVRHMRHIGGYPAFLKRISTFLDSRRTAFVPCLEILNKVDRTSNEEVLIGELALQVGDCSLGGASSEDPGVIYTWVCFAGLAGALFCAAVIVVTLVVLEGEAEGDDGEGDVGDFPIPDPGGDKPA